MGQSNAALLVSLQGHPGYECVQALSVVDINLKVKKKSFKISYELRDITWLMDPPATKGIKVPLPDILDEFDLWQKSTKRPTTDRFFTPNEKDETKEESLTCPPAACADLKFKKHLESKLLSPLQGVKYIWTILCLSMIIGSLLKRSLCSPSQNIMPSSLWET